MRAWASRYVAGSLLPTKNCSVTQFAKFAGSARAIDLAIATARGKS